MLEKLLLVPMKLPQILAFISIMISSPSIYADRKKDEYYAKACADQVILALQIEGVEYGERYSYWPIVNRSNMLTGEVYEMVKVQLEIKQPWGERVIQSTICLIDGYHVRVVKFNSGGYWNGIHESGF